MSKHKILTEEEFSLFSPNERILQFVEFFHEKSGLKKEDINILDWGCGRGRTVLWLREKGYNAFGVDIDESTIINGLDLFRIKGYKDSCLRILTNDGKTDFHDGYFHFIISNQVLEHIESLADVVTEINRLTKNGGMGFHIYPAHKKITEAHLIMPFTHWLPKNPLRKYLIAFYVMLGCEPHWKELDGTTFKEKINTYYRYSLENTYYRKYSVVNRICQKNGFSVSFVTIENPKVRNHILLGKIIRYSFARYLINHLLLNFISVELLIEKQ